MLRVRQGRFNLGAIAASMLVVLAPIVAVCGDETLQDRAQAFLIAGASEGGLPGATAGIAIDGAIVWVGAAGYSDVENKVAAVPDMVHRIASISKAMTATAAMQLVEQGKLDLDAPLRRYVPIWPQNPEGEILIRHVLNHTSGIKHYQGRENRTTEQYATLLDAVGLFKDRALAFAPGTGYSYTTYGYTALGAAIENASGMPYGDYMRAHVWGPAGMNDTSLEVFGADVPNKSKLYRRSSSGPIADFHDNNSVKYPGGGIQSTAGDLLRFATAFESGKLVSLETIERMVEVVTLPDSPNNRLDYGFGWLVGNSDEFGRFIRHDGGQSGTSTNLVILRDRRIAVSVLSNLNDASRPVGDLTWGLVAIAAGGEPRPVRP